MSAARWWTLDETNAFAALYASGKSLKECCIIFGRTEKAAIKHMQQVGIVRTVNVRRSRGGPTRSAPIGPHLIDVAKLPNEPSPVGVDSGCLWITGEPALRMFCGAPRVPSSAWCACHHVRAYDRAPKSSNAGAHSNEGEPNGETV